MSADTTRLIRHIVFPGLFILIGLFLTSGSVLAISSNRESIPASATASVPTSCDSRWEDVPTSNLGTGRGQINDIEIISPNDVWAVGIYSPGSAVPTRGIILHWDGSAWADISAPGLESGTYLNSVSASSSNDVWAVGSLGQFSDPEGRYTLTLHWDGVSWTTVRAPVSASYPYIFVFVQPLKTVIATSSTSAWAIGHEYWVSDKSSWLVQYIIRWNGTEWLRDGCDCFEILVSMSNSSTNDIWVLSTPNSSYPTREYKLAHWDGATWTSTILPDLGRFVTLESVKALSNNDVWVVGSIPNGTGGHTPVTLHWNGSAWQNVPVPSVGNGSARLFAIEGETANDVWAVGEAGCTNYSNCIQIGPLVLHWEGTQWRLASAPTLGSLHAIDIAGGGNIWGAGNHSDPWITHWDGASWAEVPSGLIGQSSNYLHGIEAVSANDIWAVGGYHKARHIEAGTEVIRTLVQHWDGADWSIVGSPNEHPTNSGYQSNILNAVSATGPNDVWAVGAIGYSPYVAGDGRFHLRFKKGLIEHWDGSSWSTVPVPAEAMVDGAELVDVEAIAANDVWAVGWIGDRQSSPYHYPLLLHWDGANWSSVTTPLTQGGLQGISATSANNVWVVGWDVNHTGGATTLHWDGTTWSFTGAGTVPEGSIGKSIAVVSDTELWMTMGSKQDYSSANGLIHLDETGWSYVTLPAIPGSVPQINNLAANSPEDVWGVGQFRDTSGKVRTLLIHYNGTEWTYVPGANVGDGDNVLSDIAFVGPDELWAVGSTQNDLAMRVLVQHYPGPYYDVAVGSTFYPYIYCLACRDIIGGYSDGSFRPNNVITRGQLAKITANAAGFNEPVGAQQFEDVAPSSTYFDYIWRLADRGLISGYSCGGTGEPCGPNNLPYFRPAANITRGQIAKIVSNGAGLTDPPGSQRFEDVAPGSTFYDFIQRLASRDVMGGYPCGSTGEPCGPGNLPYFRPQSNATRGQTAKIVSNTFFPECDTDTK